ncbi:uncharacterized protein RB166_007049 [Leptodactylus fuscus]
MSLEADIEALLQQVRQTVQLHGPGWLQGCLGTVPTDEPPVSEGMLRPRRRRARPPDRLSPEISPPLRRRRRSPARDPPASAPAGHLSPAAGRAERNPALRSRRASGGSGAGLRTLGSAPGSDADASSLDEEEAVPTSLHRREPARRRRLRASCRSSSSFDPSAAAGGPSPAQNTEASGVSPLPGGSGNIEGTAAGARPLRAAPEKVKDDVRLADLAKGEVYVCFEGPLGAHLKPEVREKIWKREYVEIFSLLPLEKFNLDRVKPDECKKEEEERRRYRLIPRTFSNWLQAFAILASVVGEKAPENCSVLFCYLDSIGEAYWVYGGNAWLRYNEHFRQRMAVRPSLRWDHKDISSWMKLMAAPKRGGGQSFREGAGGSLSGRSASGGKGCCWQFNEGQCKFGSDCKFKHECSSCGGAQALSCCFKKGRGKGGDVDQKRGNAGEGGKDGGVSRAISK